ncbi:hypothetical protein Tco_1161641 [Tanacetum coccineum]
MTLFERRQMCSAGVMRNITYEYAILLLNGNVAEIIRLSLVHSFVGVKGRHMFELRRGVNYAVPGATALDFAFHAARGVNNPMTNSSLRVQLGWFKYSLSFLCANVPGISSLGFSEAAEPSVGKSVPALALHVAMVVELLLLRNSNL